MVDALGLNPSPVFYGVWVQVPEGESSVSLAGKIWVL